MPVRMFYRRLASLHYRRTCLLVCLLLSTGLALCLDPQKDLRHYGYRSWQTDSGLPQDTVHAIIQTRDGYIWLGTEGGLVRFDGVQFVVYDKQAPAHLPSATINSLFEDSDGDLWIGTDDGLVRRRGSQFVTLTTANGLPSNTVWSVFQTRRRQGRDGVASGWSLPLASRAIGMSASLPCQSYCGTLNPKSVVEAAGWSVMDRQ